MLVDDTKYNLPPSNYIGVKTEKKKIIIGHTFNHDMHHYDGWLNRQNGKYTDTAAFTISAAGLIYKHYEPEFSSTSLPIKKLNEASILILLENDGWLIKDLKKNRFLNWVGNIYNSEVVEKKWRGFKYWAPYTEEQFNSTISLVNKLCDDFKLDKTVIGHNTTFDNIRENKTILYKSNLNKYYTDLNPTWDFSKFKAKIENEEE